MVTIKIKEKFKRSKYEKEYWANNLLVCGIDEVGRSCLAGPVVAAAAILKPYAKHKWLKDSKLLTYDQRYTVYKWLLKNCYYAVGIINHRTINSDNIYYATLQAMKRAVTQLLCLPLETRPSIILIDAMPVTLSLDIPIMHFPFGERQSPNIAAASIIAKVTRDKLMERLDAEFPYYHFKSNKGYGTPPHKKALRAVSHCIMHRIRFLSPVYNYKIN